MYKTIHEFMDKYYGHLSYDRKLHMGLKSFRLGWAQKSQGHIEFLGGKTIGVHPIPFSSLDDNMLMSEVLGVDLNLIKIEFYSVKDIDKSRKISSNIIYASLLYLVHKYLKSDYRDVEDVCIELNLIMCYKMMGSLVNRYYLDNTTEDIANSVVEHMSYQYQIKKEDNWQELFKNRTRMLLPKRGIKYKQLELVKDGNSYSRMRSFSTLDYVRVVSDIQGGLRSMIKYSYRIMLAVTHGEIDRVSSTTLIEKHEDGEGLADISERPDKHITYINSIYSIESDFINTDAIYLIKQLLPNLDTKYLENTLKYLSNNIKPGKERVPDFINTSIIHTINYVQKKGISTNYDGRLLEVMGYMKNYWSSSSVRHKDVLKAKHYLKSVTKKVTGKRTDWMLSVTSVGLLLYIFVRAMIK